MDFGIGWTYGFHGFLDFKDFWISWIFGFHGFLDLVDFYSDFGTVCVQGALTSQE